MIDTIGYISVFFHFLSFYEIKDIRKIRIYNLIATGFITIHYGGYLAYAFIIEVFSFLFQLFNFKYNESRYFKYIKNFFLIFISIVIYFVFEDKLQSLIMIIGTIFSVIAISQKDILLNKIFFLFSAISWLIYGIVIESIPSITFDIIGIIAILVSLKRIKKKN